MPLLHLFWELNGGGNGIVIKDGGIVLTIGYLVTEAETIWITDHTGTAVQGDVLGYDQESGLGTNTGTWDIKCGSCADWTIIFFERS